MLKPPSILCRHLLKSHSLLADSFSMKLFFVTRCRFCSKSETADELGTVRTRFAPSPTGIIHLGGLRTALYNYLFAKKHKGSFILRIEDTDQTRLHDKSLASIWQALRYSSLLPDEGPLSECGEEVGEMGPYTQSKRLHIYKQYSEKLLQQGKAYRCFCSNHRLTMLKQAAYKHGQTPRYDGRCRHLSEQETEERLARNEPFTLRLKLPEPMEGHQGEESPADLTATIDEGDFIIIKSDGFPTYHFANVVDDHLMKITHVLRGAEWIPAVSRHLFLYKQLGFTSPPVMKHLPLIANENGQKLSKRDQNSMFVSNFIHAGYAPEVLLNYITQSGGGFRFADSEKRVLSLDEMCESFEIDCIRGNAAILDLNKLKAVSRQYLRSQWEETGGSGKRKIIAQLKQVLAEYNLDEAVVDDSVLERILEHRIRDVKTVKDLVVSPETRFLWAWEAPLETSFVGLQKKNKMIDYAIEQIESCKEPLDVDDVMTALSRKDAPFPRNKVLSAMRLCLSIHCSGPRVVDMVMMLGKKETVRRLQQSVLSLRQNRDNVVKQIHQLEQQNQSKSTLNQ